MTAGRDAASPARSLKEQRRFRRELFGKSLFDGPAWDILLELHIAAAEGRLVSLDELYRDSTVLPSTGGRWVKALQIEGLVARGSEFRIGVDFVRLTVKGHAAMNRYFERVFPGCI
ncbi:hypothetical protein [Altericroceibacterium xinjiangense]|uniref:hypothetical protein n=1 Tax=Altericroceibacterium xinjiangense TaxID=762261 RepID=UPI000F7D70AC|nr:hypothetical protein [Altericroceibacterium xinjiangense]